MRKVLFLAAIGLLSIGPSALADDWVMTITVDNQYDIYFGTDTTTTFYAGGDNNWFTVETWNAFGRAPTDYLYVATASDHGVAQGFLGHFVNVTSGQSISTGDQVWEVFPAGAYLQAIDPTWPNPWPFSLQPTQAQVDAAIAYATANNLWIAPSTLPGWTNASHPGPWMHNMPGIPANAQWIWHDAGTAPPWLPYPAPFGGWNHDEFLIFRVPGIVPEPAALLLLGLGTLLIRRRG